MNNRATDADHVPCVLIRGGLAVHQNGNGEVQMSEVGYTVSTNSNASGRNTPIVLVYESHNQDSRYNPLGEVCETVSAKYGTGGGNQPIVVEYERNDS